MQQKIENCVAAVLCGGRSSRMGFDKAFLQWKGDLLLQQILGELQQIFSKVVLVTNKQDKFNNSGLALGGCTIIEDAYTEMGPIGGICTALEGSEAEYVFIVACDMPFFTKELVAQLYSAVDDQQVILFEKEGRLETLFAFYHRSCLPLFQRQIQEGKRQIRKEFAQLTVKTVPAGEKEDKAFTNINTKEDIEKWQNK